jgi:hypothetical protein
VPAEREQLPRCSLVDDRALIVVDLAGRAYYDALVVFDVSGIHHIGHLYHVEGDDYELPSDCHRLPNSVDCCVYIDHCGVDHHLPRS